MLLDSLIVGYRDVISLSTFLQQYSAIHGQVMDQHHAIKASDYPSCMDIIINGMVQISRRNLPDSESVTTHSRVRKSHALACKL